MIAQAQISAQGRFLASSENHVYLLILSSYYGKKRLLNHVYLKILSSCADPAMEKKGYYFQNPKFLHASQLIR